MSPKRDIAAIMQDGKPVAPQAVGRMKSLMGDDSIGRVKPTPKPKPPEVKRWLVGENPYKALGVGKDAIKVINRVARALDPEVMRLRGPPPLTIGGARGLMYHWHLGPVEHYAIKLVRAAQKGQLMPDGCPDPLLLAKALIQEWYAEWGAELEEATGIQPG